MNHSMLALHNHAQHRHSPHQDHYSSHDHQPSPPSYPHSPPRSSTHSGATPPTLIISRPDSPSSETSNNNNDFQDSAASRSSTPTLTTFVSAPGSYESKVTIHSINSASGGYHRARDSTGTRYGGGAGKTDAGEVDQVLKFIEECIRVNKEGENSKRITSQRSWRAVFGQHSLWTKAVDYLFDHGYISRQTKNSPAVCKPPYYSLGDIRLGLLETRNRLLGLPPPQDVRHTKEHEPMPTKDMSASEAAAALRSMVSYSPVSTSPVPFSKNDSTKRPRQSSLSITAPKRFKPAISPPGVFTEDEEEDIPTSDMNENDYVPQSEHDNEPEYPSYEQVAANPNDETEASIGTGSNNGDEDVDEDVDASVENDDDDDDRNGFGVDLKTMKDTGDAIAAGPTTFIKDFKDTSNETAEEESDVFTIPRKQSVLIQNSRNCTFRIYNYYR